MQAFYMIARDPDVAGALLGQKSVRNVFVLSGPIFEKKRRPVFEYQFYP